MGQSLRFPVGILGSFFLYSSSYFVKKDKSYMLNDLPLYLLQGMLLPCSFTQHPCTFNSLHPKSLHAQEQSESVTDIISYLFSRLTFVRVIRKGSTEEFSCIPYIIALLNCLLYTWFGMPVVSKGWENFTVATINGLGILLEASFIIIYIKFASAKRKARLLLCNSQRIFSEKICSCNLSVIISMFPTDKRN